MVVPAQSLRFGPFRWDAFNRLLLREGTEIALPPRVMAVLECLVERPGQVISRQELIDRVWKDAFVTDTSLAEAISFLRQALGDDPQNPQYIQTLHRRGYRFVASVEPDPEPMPSAGPPDQGPENRRPQARPSIGGALLPWSLVTLLGATLTVAIWRLEHPPTASQPRVARFELAPPAGATFDASHQNLAISPDGRLVAFSACTTGGCRLYLREVRELAPHPLEDTTGGVSPFFSPDGRAIGFFADGHLKRTSTSGGTPIVLADAPDALGGTWLNDGRIVFAVHEFGGLEVVSENGGRPTELTRVDARAGELGHRFPRWLTGTDWLVFTTATAPDDPQADRAMALSLSTGRSVTVTGRATGATLIAPDILVFGRGQELDAARFDHLRGMLSGIPMTVARDVQSSRDGMPLFAASAEGTTLLVPGRPRPPQLEIADSTGSKPVAGSLSLLQQPALDKAGLTIAGVISDGLRSDLWLGDTFRGATTRLTNQYTSAVPAWSADGRAIVFSAAPDGTFNLWLADPSGPSARPILKSPLHQFASAVTGEGDIVFTQIDPATRGDIWVTTPEGRVTALVRTPFDERDAAISPDRRWLAYLSDESGLWKLYVKRLDGGHRFVVSQGSAGRPWWLADGRLVYVAASGVLEQLQITDEGIAAPGLRREFPGAVILAVSSAGAVLLARQPPIVTPAVVAIQAWQDIRRALPPAVANLPR